MVSVVFLTAAGVTFVAALYKARGLRLPHHSPALGQLCLFLGSLSLAFLFLSPAAQTVENGLYPNLGRLLGNVCTVFAAYAALALLIDLAHPAETAKHKIRLWLVALGVTVAVMATLFLSTPLSPVIGGFDVSYRAYPTLAGYVLVYAAFLGTAVTNLLVVSWRYARHALHRPYLRLGLRIISVGCAVALVYLAEKVTYVVTELAALPPLVPGGDQCTSLVAPPACLFAVTFPATAVLLMVLGATIPAWGPALEVAPRWLRRVRIYRRLHPLWAALYEAVPQIALTAPAASGRAPRGMGFRLYRRVIEIRDGCLALRPYRDASAAQSAREAAERAGLRGDALAATVEAAEIAAALEAKKAGRRTNVNVPPTVPGGDVEPSDLTGEASWLAKVATAFVSSSGQVSDHARPDVRPTDPSNRG